jgi:hypothetical protein
MTPVDMKALGFGFANLYKSGVSKELCDPWLEKLSVGRGTPKGRDFAKLC